MKFREHLTEAKIDTGYRNILGHAVKNIQDFQNDFLVSVDDEIYELRKRGLIGPEDQKRMLGATEEINDKIRYIKGMFSEIIRNIQ